MGLILAADFGSTFTKLTAIDAEEKRIVACSKSFTTVETDVMDGYCAALEAIQKQCGASFSKKIASSSAAGGLKMISVGLVPDLTAKASRMAAASAGAMVLKTFSYELSPEDQEEINALLPDILLLCGGIDGGNKEVILHNARMIADIKASFAVIVAGNRSVAHQIADIIQASGKRAVICENVMPAFGQLNIEPAREAIRGIFIENIISAKGLDRVGAMMDEEIIPTPLAVYNAMELLSCGSGAQEGLGDLMAYDIGGATTDVYSMCAGLPQRANTYMHGLKEPFAKRTVEGDIGMRYSIVSLIDLVGEADVLSAAGVAREELLSWAECCGANPESLPEAGSCCQKIDETLAAFAVKISAARHCGSTEVTYTSSGEMTLQTGKDLTGVKSIVGTGGVIINSSNPAKMMGNALYSPQDLNLLKPISARFLLDRKGILTAMGLLGSLLPECALHIMKEELIPVSVA